MNPWTAIAFELGIGYYDQRLMAPWAVARQCSAGRRISLRRHPFGGGHERSEAGMNVRRRHQVGCDEVVACHEVEFFPAGRPWHRWARVRGVGLTAAV